jgi:hypothetical protein
MELANTLQPVTLALTNYTVFCCVCKAEHGEELVETAKQVNVAASKLKPIFEALLDSLHQELYPATWSS